MSARGLSRREGLCLLGSAAAMALAPAASRAAQTVQMISHRYPALEFYAEKMRSALPGVEVNTQLMPHDKAMELATIALSVELAFLFGYALSILPLLKAGMGLVAAGSVVLAADTLSIVTMEVVDNLVMVVSPGTMDAGLVNVIFWLSMALAFLTAFVVAVPVNRYLVVRGKGHALTHHHHQNVASNSGGWRTYIPNLGTSALVAALAAFMLGGLVVSAAAELTPVRDVSTPAADSSGH